MYQNFLRVIENINVIISTYQNMDIIGDFQVYPDSGTVAFGSVLNIFAKIFAAKLNIEKKK